MDSTLKSIQNSGLAKIAAGAPSQVLGAIQKASAKTGVNFAYMVQQAAAESSFNPSAKAKTSSASGLYQFIKSTWLDMVGKYGEKYGVDTDQPRAELLKLREDPEIASYMAAEFAGENQRFLEQHWGGEVGSTELYFAHFMGAGGASAFMKARDEDPSQKAALLFPDAAKANRNVFYDTKTGRAKSIDEVYAFFDNKFQVENVDLPKPQEKPQSVIWANDQRETIAWNPPSVMRRSANPLTQYQKLVNPYELMMLSQLELPLGDKSKSLF